MVMIIFNNGKYKKIALINAILNSAKLNSAK